MFNADMRMEYVLSDICCIPYMILFSVSFGFVTHWNVLFWRRKQNMSDRMKWRNANQQNERKKEKKNF